MCVGSRTRAGSVKRVEKVGAGRTQSGETPLIGACPRRSRRGRAPRPRSPTPAELGHEPAELVAALLEAVELVEARARGAQEHHVAGTRSCKRMLDRTGERFIVVGVRHEPGE